MKKRNLRRVDAFTEVKSESGIIAQLLCSFHQRDVFIECDPVVAILEVGLIDAGKLEQPKSVRSSGHCHVQKRAYTTRGERQLRHVQLQPGVMFVLRSVISVGIPRP